MTSDSCAHDNPLARPWMVFHRPTIGKYYCVARFKYRSHAELYYRALVQLCESNRDEYVVTFDDPAARLYRKQA